MTRINYDRFFVSIYLVHACNVLCWVECIEVLVRQSREEYRCENGFDLYLLPRADVAIVPKAPSRLFCLSCTFSLSHSFPRIARSSVLGSSHTSRFSVFLWEMFQLCGGSRMPDKNALNSKPCTHGPLNFILSPLLPFPSFFSLVPCFSWNNFQHFYSAKRIEREQVEHSTSRVINFSYRKRRFYL